MARTKTLHIGRPTLKFGASGVRPGVYLNVVKPRVATEPWTPSEIVTACWFDAADVETITEVSGSVSQWDDKSGNLNHVSEGTAVYQPTYSSTGWDGSLPTIDFTITGSDGNQLASLTSNGFTGTEHVIFAMTEPLSRNNQTRHTVLKLSSSAGAKDLYNKASAGVKGMGTRDATLTYVGEVPGRPIRKQMLTYDYSSGGEFYRDGDSVFSGAWNPKTILIDGGFKISSATSSRYDGKMSEIIIMNRSDCDNATRQKVEGYLAWKWGVESYLPIGHPYKYDGSLFGYGKLWTPSDIVTACWFDAADISTITETAGAVSQWDDKSGNDCHAVQATGISQPITNSRTLNGLNVLDFDGSNDDMSMVAGPHPDSAQTIMIAVADLDSPLKAEGQRLLNFQAGTSSRWSLRLEDELLAQYINAASFTGPEIAITSGARLIAGHRDGTTVGVSVDGGVPITDTSGGNATVDTWKVGSYNSANDFLDGGYAEVVVLKSYNLGLFQKLEGYLAWKWGLVANLPIGHPYKDAAPNK